MTPEQKANLKTDRYLQGCARLVQSYFLFPAPEVTESETGTNFSVLSLEALVRIKLTSFRLKDWGHLLDLLEVGLIDESWSGRFQAKCGLLSGSDRVP